MGPGKYGASGVIIFTDQICINQKDAEEKKSQVAMMSKIYMLAKKVLVWLGEADEYSKMVFGSNPLSRMFQSNSEQASAWTSLLTRPYWNRTWIIQEFLLARKVVIFCGPDQMSGDSVFAKPLQSHFGRVIQKNKKKKKGFEGIPRSFLLYLYKQKQKRPGLFSSGKLYFANTDIFEIAFSFQYTECQMGVDHVYGLLALEDPSKGRPIEAEYKISAQDLFLNICMSRLPTATKNVNKVTDDGAIRVAQLFEGLRFTFDNAEEILDIMSDNNQSNPQSRIVIATIAKAFDQFGFLKPERKQWILPQTKAPLEAEQIISAMRKWQMAQKESGNWYNIQDTAQIHRPPGMTFRQLEEPLWSQYSILRDTTAAKTAQAGNIVNINNIQNMNNINNMNMMNNLMLTNPAMMGGAGMGGMGA
ncbi:hypothetical protein M8818_001883 [Zalaria obscura]|uniref:Uncharacterized protein n=1 Tax=Zalaria obscura TaxID=2024903 RepID=A0ACC3SID0_9PEZI